MNLPVEGLYPFPSLNSNFRNFVEICRQNCMKGDDFSLAVLKIPSFMLLVKSIMRNTLNFDHAMNKLTLSKNHS